MVLQGAWMLLRWMLMVAAFKGLLFCGRARSFDQVNMAIQNLQMMIKKWKSLQYTSVWRYYCKCGKQNLKMVKKGKGYCSSFPLQKKSAFHLRFVELKGLCLLREKMLTKKWSSMGLSTPAFQVEPYTFRYLFIKHWYLHYMFKKIHLL